MKETYLWGTKVKFQSPGMEEPREGFVENRDVNGTFLRGEEGTAYDIRVPSENMKLYKHILHREIIERLPQEDFTRGRLEYNRNTGEYDVLVSDEGYRAIIEKWHPAEIRTVWEKEWILAFSFDFEKYVGCSVEIRHCDLVLRVDNLFDALQDDENLFCEVYKCDDNVVLMDGGYFLWGEENLVLRGNKTCAKYYRDQRVYRWDYINGILRLCLGRIEPPSVRVLEMAEDFLQNRFGISNKRKWIIDQIDTELFKRKGLSAMVYWAGIINDLRDVDIITPVTGAGFCYKKDGWIHKVFYENGNIIDAELLPEDEKDRFYAAKK